MAGTLFKGRIRHADTSNSSDAPILPPGAKLTPRRLIEPARLAGSRMLLGTQSDERLVDLCRAGYAAAFEAIVERYRQPLLRHCMGFLPAARAEDAVQQAFANAYRALMDRGAEINLRPWLYRIAQNAALNQLRDRGQQTEELSEDIDGVERPDQAFERRERFASVIAAVRGLPERQRDAILLREFEGRSYDEIAATLGVRGGAVRQLLHRARTGVRGAATALTPYGLAERLLGETGSQVAQATAGAGVGAVLAKASAAVLVTGAVVGGAVHGPPGGGHHSAAKPDTHASVVHEATLATAGSPSTGTPVSDPGQSQGFQLKDKSRPVKQRRTSGHNGARDDSGRQSPTRGGDHRGDGGHDQSGSGGRSRDGSADTSKPDDHSGSGSSGGGSGSGSSDSSGSGSGDASHDLTPETEPPEDTAPPPTVADAPPAATTPDN